LSEAKSRSEAVAGNGRMYDAALCRFLSPDPHVQMPDYSQNFNRYSYALNNPLVYTDPSGEFIFGYTFGFFRGLFSGKNPFQEGWETGVNELKIYGGLFATDPNKEPHERAWEFVSRFTWQLPQTIGGFASAYWTNNFTDVNWVKYKYGTTVLQTNGEWGGITQGNYIIGDKSIETDVGNRLFQHEYGHYIQSQKSGWFYYSKYGIPSALSKKPHNQNLVEQDANVRAFLYFSEHVDGFNWVDKWGNQRSKWVSWYNPINRYDWSRPITDHANQLALKNGTLKLSWHDYSLGPNILLSGLLNALILNHEY
nr:endonuclease [Bacteroidota bacterium]